MTNKQSKKKAAGKKALNAGEKFWQEYLKTPYSNDRVGQAFVRPVKGQAIVTKSSEIATEKTKSEEQSIQDTSTQDPGLKFLEVLDRTPYSYDRVGQVSIVHSQATI